MKAALYHGPRDIQRAQHDHGDRADRWREALERFQVRSGNADAVRKRRPPG
jgi:hypothetical protein